MYVCKKLFSVCVCLCMCLLDAKSYLSTGVLNEFTIVFNHDNITTFKSLLIIVSVVYFSINQHNSWTKCINITMKDDNGMLIILSPQSLFVGLTTLETS